MTSVDLPDPVVFADRACNGVAQEVFFAAGTQQRRPPLDLQPIRRHRDPHAGHRLLTGQLPPRQVVQVPAVLTDVIGVMRRGLTDQMPVPLDDRRNRGSRCATPCFVCPHGWNAHQRSPLMAATG